MTNQRPNEKLGSMFKGVLSPVVGLAGLNALLFVSYGSIIRYFESQYVITYPSPHTETFEPSLFQVYLAGAGAGVACFFFSTPTDLIKIQAQMTKIPKTTWEVTKEIYARNGLRGNQITRRKEYNSDDLYIHRFLSRWGYNNDPRCTKLWYLFLGI